MTRKKENYDLWLKEIRERHRIRNAKRREKKKQKKNATRTWKPGCIITFKTLDSNRKSVVYVCRMKRVPKRLLVHSCYACRIINHTVPCLKIKTNTHAKCMIKRQLDTFPCIEGIIDRHGKYHARNVLL